ncbi:DUF4145 domain-containing protein [Acinetobacter calcoaceticus]|uniref:DUF4145 domain-containing protein n=1 Tax=Acinetobacter calcoaceticus TaxID=471 RepID=UPI0005F01B1F|nr:DUF4145 domain-containing protein [Acinetobacter calcoaceticus]
MAFSWTCPYCNQNATITDSNLSTDCFKFNDGNLYGAVAFQTRFITCPNKKCKEFTITAQLNKASDIYTTSSIQEHIMSWQLKPNSSAKHFPSYIPKAILADYNEACLIRDLSPKASATLSRRCLQGMIRDFWGETKSRLIDEIYAIKDRIDPITWQAIDAVRKIGNIGAHMEKDIDLIIDVDPNEAQMLIGLIEMLMKEWYIARHERQKQLEALIGLDAQKAEQKNIPKLVNE